MGVPWFQRGQELNASIKSFYLWSSVQKLRLTTNMRLQLSGEDADRTFPKQLLDVGNGTSIDVKDGRATTDWPKTCAVLAPKNVAIDDLNIKILEQLPGVCHIYNSIDTVLNIDEAVNYPVEFLNSPTSTGLPPHNLHLEIRAPVMLLRNLDPPKLCNGTRLIIKNVMLTIL
uniref:ATP-dependent DNA helicase n=1 Tax=Octopus bimaculoides TaxID=37653 RepID=A0A0L8GV44_OCTBM